jgi:hypothetical protein
VVRATVLNEPVLRAAVLGEPAPAESAVTPDASEEPAQRAAAGIAVSLELPDGSSRELGVTDAFGVLKFQPEVPGQHAFSASISGVRCVASLPIAPARNRWLLAIVCVPLGLALLWLQIRRLRAGLRAGKPAAAQ